MAYIPTTTPPPVLVIPYNELFPEVAPIVLPVVVPILAFPEVTLIPHKIPLVVVAPLEVYKAIPAIVLF